MLLQVPKGLGGAKIHTAAVTAAITGTTIMMEYSPGQYLKVLVLEGSLRLSRNGSFGDSLVLHPGKMVIMRPDAKKIPDPIDIDLAEIVRTSTLVNFPGSKVLPSMPLIQAAITDQAKAVAKGTLVPTNLVMGHGTKVVLASNDQLAKTVGQVGLLGASLNGGALKGIAPLSTVGSVAANVSSSATTVVNNLLGSGPVVSVSSSTQVLSLLSNATPNSGGIITITPAAINAGASVAVAPSGAMNVSAAAGTVSAAVTSPQLAIFCRRPGVVPTLLTPVGTNASRRRFTSARRHRNSSRPGFASVRRQGIRVEVRRGQQKRDLLANPGRNVRSSLSNRICISPRSAGLSIRHETIDLLTARFDSR